MRAELTGAEQITVETWPTKAGGKSVMASCLQCAAAASIEGDADSFFLASYDVAVPPQVSGRHVQGDLVGNANRASDFQKGSSSRNIAHDAIDTSTVEFNRSGLKGARARF